MCRVIFRICLSQGYFSRQEGYWQLSSMLIHLLSTTSKVKRFGNVSMLNNFKTKTVRDPKYLAFLRKQPCCVCRWIPSTSCSYLIEAHHTTTGGMGIKGSDLQAVPLCFACHRHVHEHRKDSIGNLEEIISKLRSDYGKKTA